MIDRSLHKGSGDNPVTPAAAAAAGDCEYDDCLHFILLPLLYY